MSAVQAISVPEHIRMSEHTEVIAHEYAWRGERRFRERHYTRYAACCLRCHANVTADLLPSVRRWARNHECEVAE